MRIAVFLSHRPALGIKMKYSLKGTVTFFLSCLTKIFGRRHWNLYVKLSFQINSYLLTYMLSSYKQRKKKITFFTIGKLPIDSKNFPQNSKIKGLKRKNVKPQMCLQVRVFSGSLQNIASIFNMDI